MNDTSRQRLTSFLFLIVSLVLLLVQSTIIFNDFVWDDELLLGYQAKHTASQPSFSEILTTDFLGNFDYPGLAPNHFWRPLTSMILECSIRSFENWTIGFRLVSLLCWVFATSSFFFFIRKVTPKPYTSVPVLATLIWASHPVGADVIAMVVSISDFLSVFFLFVCATVAFYAFAKGLNGFFILVAFLSALLAVSAKEIGLFVVFIPAMVALLYKKEVMPIKRSFFISFVLTLCFTIAVLLYLFARSSILPGSAAPPAFNDFSRWLVLYPSFFGAFMIKIFLPLNLSSVYYFDSTMGLEFWVGALGLILILIVFLMTFQGKIQTRLPVFGFLWAIATLAISSLAVNPKSTNLGIPPRYFYVSLAGFAVASVPLWTFVQKRVGSVIFVILSTTTIGVFVLVMFTRIADWRNDITYNIAEVVVNPDKVQPHVHLAWALVKSGYYERASQEVKDIRSLRPYGKAVRAQVLSVEAKILAEKDKEYPKAIKKLQSALRLTPHDLSLVLGIAELKRLKGDRVAATETLHDALGWPQFEDQNSQRILKGVIGALRDEPL